MGALGRRGEGRKGRHRSDASHRLLGNGRTIRRKPHADHGDVPDPQNSGRSEEHTSELQSRQYLVCRLLLEKKKKEDNGCSNTHIVQRTGLQESMYSIEQRVSKAVT